MIRFEKISNRYIKDKDITMKDVKVFVLMLGLTVCATSVFAADAVVALGKKVKMDYTLTVDKEQVETSVGKEPLEIIYGDRSIIPGLESAIAGMKVGEERVIDVEAKDAYGDVEPGAIKEFPKSSMPTDPAPQVGMILQAESPEGESFPAMIKEIKGDTVVMDFNHPLAGKKLTFKIKILDVSDAPASVPAAPAAAQ